MTDYTELVKALRWCSVDEYVPCTGCPMNEETHGTGCFNIMHQRAAAAIEALQEELIRIYKQLPKRGEWKLIDGAEPMRWGCSRCKYMSWDTSNYCPRCGAKMREMQE